MRPRKKASSFTRRFLERVLRVSPTRVPSCLIAAALVERNLHCSERYSFQSTRKSPKGELCLGSADEFLALLRGEDFRHPFHRLDVKVYHLAGQSLQLLGLCVHYIFVGAVENGGV